MEMIVCNTWLERSIGLMFRKQPAKCIIKFNKSTKSIIHTWFMRFNINIILMDEGSEIIKRYDNVKPWEIIVPNVEYLTIWEIPSGSKNSEVKVLKGDVLKPLKL